MMDDPPQGMRGATVYIVDDDPAVRASVGRLLVQKGYAVRLHSSGVEFLEACEGGAGPWRACIVLDLQMPEMDGLALQEALRARGNTTPIVFVTGHGDIRQAVAAMQRGATDFLEKPYDPAQLLSAVERALSASVAPGLSWSQTDCAAAHERLANLAPRERDVLLGLLNGLANKQIAHRLGLSVRTVEGYRASMMERLGVGSLPEAVRLALMGRLDTVVERANSSSA